MKIQINDIRLIDPFQNKNQKVNLYIEDGYFVEKLSGQADHSIEGKGLYAAPGFIDAHTHLRDPGQTYKEDIISGTQAGAKGGYVLLAAMPNTSPICDSPELVRYMIEKAETKGSCQVLPIPAVSVGEQGEQLTDFQALKEAGAGGLTDDGRPISTAKLLREALIEASKHNLIVIDHPEETSLSRGTSINLGKISKELGLEGMPNSSESIAVARDILVAMELGLPIHLCHVSTKESIDLIRMAKNKGVKVTADVCPHHFCLTQEAVVAHGSNAKMYPPLRTEEDRLACIAGLRDGTIDMIATDHAPHHADEKGEDIAKAMMGIVGLETAFPLSYTELCLKEGFSLEKLLELFTKAPAKLFGLENRSIIPGNPANMVIFETGISDRIDSEKFVSKSRNTPFNGWEVKARIKATIWKGNFTYVS